jgi:hypothetical protein
VIVANPNGITCDGCGFINTTRGTLTTGTPVFGNDGSLSAFRVSRGTIRLEGNGLDAGNLEGVDLLARAVQLNAGLWARQVNVVTGANQIDAQTLATQAITGEGERPQFGLDVAALGHVCRQDPVGRYRGRRGRAQHGPDGGRRRRLHPDPGRRCPPERTRPQAACRSKPTVT